MISAFVRATGGIVILGSGLIQAANTFVGAYDDISSIAAAYSTRRLLTSYTGPLLRLVADRTGYPEQDIGYTAAGDLDTAAAASFLSGDAGYVTKWYDQSSAALHMSQATLAAMPLYVASAQNSLPTMRFDGTNDVLASGSVILSQAHSVIAVADSNNTTNYMTDVFWSYAASVSGASDVEIGIYPTPTNNNLRMRYPGLDAYSSETLAELQSCAAIVQCRISTTSAKAYVNGALHLDRSDTTIDFSTPAIFRVGRHTSAEQFLNGDVAELVVCNAVLSDLNRASVFASINSHWSIY